MTPFAVSLVSLAAVLVMMLGELRHSRANERRLLRMGAVRPPDPVYPAMQWAYPGVFVAMAIEGALGDRGPGAWTAAGGVLLIAAKALKYWAIAALGPRWTYRVLVLPGQPLVTSGPYRLMRHPNYAAVLGELVGMALLVAAPWTGVGGTLLFGALLRGRITAEEKAGGALRATGARG